MPALASLFALVATFAPQHPAPQPPPETVTLSGRVVDLRGEGVPVAEVWVTHQTDERLARTVTDAEGFFRVGKVPKRPWWTVWAQADGLCKASDFTRASSSPLQIRLHEATTVTGVLLHDGKPLPGVIVAGATTGRALHLTEQASTDAEGRFAIERVPLGPTAFAAWVPELGLLHAEHRVVGDDSVTLRPLETPTTSMTIAIDGLPKEGRPEVKLAWLPYSGGSLSYLPGPLRQPTLTSGEWQMERIPDWRYVVRLQADGWTFEPNEITVLAGKGPHQLGFVAHEVGETSLAWPAIARDAAGAPVANVSFVLRRSSGGAQAEATSDQDGKLAFQSPLAAGTEAVVYPTDDRWVVDQTKAADMYGTNDRRFLVYHECVVEPGKTLELQLVPACSVTGKVLFADGRPAAGVDVRLEGEAANRIPRWMAFAYATTDQTGTYRFVRQHHHGDGVRVHVEGRSGDADSEAFVLDAPGSKVVVQPLQLTPIAIVEGVVRGADGKPAPGIAVWLRDWDMAKSQQRSGSVTEVITDRQGRYRFVGVPLGGAYLMFAGRGTQMMGKAQEPFEVEAGKTYEFELHHDDQ